MSYRSYEVESYKGKSYEDADKSYRNFIQEQKDTAQARIDVCEGAFIGVVCALTLLLLVGVIAVMCAA